MSAKKDTSHTALGAPSNSAAKTYGLNYEYALVDLMNKYKAAPSGEAAELAFEALAREMEMVAKTDALALFNRPFSRTLLTHAISFSMADKLKSGEETLPPGAELPLSERQARATKMTELVLSTLGSPAIVKMPGHQTRYAMMILSQDDRRMSALVKAVQSGDTKLYDRIAAEVFAQRKNGEIDKYTMAQQFVDPTAKNESLLHSALYSGNTELYDRVSSMLKVLRDGQAIDDNLYNLQFVLATPNNQLPLFTAANSGNGELFNHYMRDFDALPLELRKQKLQDSTLNQWNVIGNALQPKNRYTSATTLVRLRDSVTNAFGAEEGQKICEALASQINDLGYSPINRRTPDWKRALLEDPRPVHVENPKGPRQRWTPLPLNQVSDAMPEGIHRTIKR